jgi:nitroreductase
MDFIELTKLRQSVRKYDPRPVERDKILKCLEAARFAPSASNSQPWHFIVVDEPELKNKVAEATFDPLVSFNRYTLSAPAIIVLVTEKSGWFTRLAARLMKREFSLIDSGIAAEHFCLQAAELGMGTCLIGWFKQEVIKKLLNIPREKFITLVISLGYPLQDYPIRVKARKSLDKISNWNRY